MGNPACNDRKRGGRWGFSPQTLAKEPSALWTLIRGDQAGAKARLAEGEPRLRGSRRTKGAPRRGCAGLSLSVTATAVTPSPPGKGTWLRELGRSSPTVAPLRPGLRPPSWGMIGGDLLRRPTEATHAPPAMRRVRKTVSCLFRQLQGRWGSSPRPANPRATRAATVPPDRLRTSDTAPQNPSCRPREDVNSLAQREVSPSALTLLVPINCPVPFASFPRAKKNITPIRRWARENSRSAGERLAARVTDQPRHIRRCPRPRAAA